MSRATLLAILFGVLLIASPVVRAEEEDDDDDAEEAAGGDAAEKDVVVLTTKNFDATLKKHKFVLAEFYAPWCGHCKKLAPHYAAAASIIKKVDPEVVIGKVDATVEKDLGTKFGVQGYPTLKWFVDGEPTEYNGPRETEGIVAWIKKKIGPPTTTVEDADKLTELEKESAAVAVGYFKELSGAAYDAFKAAAVKTEDVVFVDTTKADVAKLAGLTAPGTVAMIKNFKGEPRATVAYEGELSDEDAFKLFITAEKIPLTIEFNQENSPKIFGAGLKQQILLWASAAELEAGHEVYDAFKAVATELKGKMVFVTIDNTGASHEPVTNFFGLKDAKSPQVIGFYMEKNRKYKLKEEFSLESLKAFASGVLDGSVEPDYKSAPIPEDNKDGDVTVVVGKTVDSIVFDEGKDVLLEVYAPWCGHCKQLEPIYKKLAKRFKKVDSVVIAKMDGTENEHPKFEVKGFPTIFFIPAGGKEVLSFEGDRTLKGFTKYIKDHAKVPYTLPKKEGKDEDGKADAKDEL